jgi:hypothetical protein
MAVLSIAHRHIRCLPCPESRFDETDVCQVPRPCLLNSSPPFQAGRSAQLVQHLKIGLALTCSIADRFKALITEDSVFLVTGSIMQDPGPKF